MGNKTDEPVRVGGSSVVIGERVHADEARMIPLLRDLAITPQLVFIELDQRMRRDYARINALGVSGQLEYVVAMDRPAHQSPDEWRLNTHPWSVAFADILAVRVLAIEEEH